MHATSVAEGRPAHRAASRRRRPAASFLLAVGLVAFMAGMALVGSQVLGFPLSPSHPATSSIDMSLVAPPPEPDVYGWQIKKYNGQPPLSPDGPVGGMAFNMSIPAIGYSSAVRVGTDKEILDQGPGWYEGSGWPGEAGNVGIAGHNSFWLSFARLSPGDKVVLQTKRGTYTYQILDSYVVDPSDKNVLIRTADPELRLTTCYPLWAGAFATQRQIWRATLVAGG